MTRTEILAEASRLTVGDRNKSYGHPHANMTAIGDLFTTYLTNKYGGSFSFEVNFTAEDVCWFMVLVKMERSRHAFTPDNYIDAAAYAAMAGECAAIDKENEE